LCVFLGDLKAIGSWLDRDVCILSAQRIPSVLA
jgi:hypothetical protein